MDAARVEEEARRLQREIYARRRELWPSEEVHPLEMVNPEVAAQVLRIDFKKAQSLSFDVLRGEKRITAGILDRPGGEIWVATEFGADVTRFTAAHEIGHWVLHPKQVIHHRDRPLKGLTREVRQPMEQEADRFAAAFLIPEKFFRKVFRSAFLTDKPFVFDNNAAFFLSPDDPDAVLYPEKDSKARELALARAKSYNGKAFQCSLAEMFGVSPLTMAIRIEELGLVKAWP
jgi:hypothetical protein